MRVKIDKHDQKVLDENDCGTGVYLKRVWDPFLESPDNFSGPKSCFMFAVFAFKIKVSIILKTIQWNYQLANKIDQFVSLELC